MASGNTQDMVAGDGRRIVDLGRVVIPPGEIAEFRHNYLPCHPVTGELWTASFRGWYRDHQVGTGPTRAAAIADLRALTGIDPAKCAINDEALEASR